MAKAALVEELLGASGHLSARELHEAMTAQHPQMDHSTVYRALHILAEDGIVHSLGGPGHTLFGLADEPHHHVVCGVCGSVAEIPAGDLGDLVAAAESRTGYSFSAQSLTLAGRCVACAG
ncbi:hypothetical protein GCM10010172_29690 [Paractinoplanes ferrugineus]|uniref:Transcriptional repressor n=1 Tax=Paractinoplanes ferrugineus TaxID=113564 RepID=A0A919JEF8_9ACTN|nr:hypothetical protein Afe05nite_75060 [Actinoplanes ferrugineus]